METNGHKKVIQYSDQFFCSWCGKTWDANDPHPPECSEKQKSFRTVLRGRDRLNYRLVTDAAIEMSVFLRDRPTAEPVLPAPPQAYTCSAGVSASWSGRMARKRRITTPYALECDQRTCDVSMFRTARTT